MPQPLSTALSRRNFLKTSLAATATWTISGFAADPPKNLAVALLADSHTNLEIPAHQDHWAAVIRQVRESQVDVVLIAGDLADNIGSTGQWADFMGQIGELTMPVLVVPGNHDVGHKIIPGLGHGVTSEECGNFARVIGPNWWVREIAGLRIVGVNSCLFGSGLPEEASQFQFLEETLKSPAPSQRTILLTHYPLFVESPEEPGGVYVNIDEAPRKKLFGLLERGAVSGVFSGHLHHPILHELNGVHYVGAPAISFGLPREQQPEGWARIVIPPKGKMAVDWRYLAT